MRLAVVLVLCLGACGDDLSVTVDVTHPGPVAKTVISVYESDAVDCTKVEFGDLDATQLDATLVAEETIVGTTVTGDLDGLSRTATKTIVARGYDVAGTFVTAGCSEKGAVTGADTVAITTVIVATVSAVSEANDPYTIAVLATTPGGTLLKNRTISWRVYGPTGTAAVDATSVQTVGDSEWQPATPACTNGNGIAKIHPIPPSMIGGFATRVRVSWAADQLPFQSALTKTDFTPTAINPPGTVGAVAHPCAIKISGTTRRLVCIDSAAGLATAHEYTITAGSGRATLAVTNTASIPGSAQVIGVVAVPAAAADREVYAVDNNGSLIPLFGASNPAATTCPGIGMPCAGTVSDFQLAPACGDPDNTAKLYLKVGLNTLRAMPAHGGVATDIRGFVADALDSLDFDGAGCITQVTPAGSKASRQLVVITTSKGVGLNTIATTRGFYNCAGLTCGKLALPVADGGIGFVLSGTENRLVGTSVDATGVSVSSWVMLPDPDPAQPDRLLERDRVAAASLPHKIVVGKLDDDDGYDLLWDLASKRGEVIEVAYSRMSGSQRLEAVSTTQGVLVNDMFLDDLSGDGHPEIVIVSVPTTAGLVGVIVIPTHVAPAMATLVVDGC